MDLIDDIGNIKLVFKEFIKNPSLNYISVYNALTKNYLGKSNDNDEFETYKALWQKHPKVFKKGYEPYTPNTSNPGFFHVKDATYDDLQTRKHRIYINPSVKNREKFVHVLIKECLANNVSFYFKYARGDYKTDNLLIYASDEQLEQYAKILKDIEKNHSDIISDYGLTPLSATSIGWYAYGPEDKSSEKGSLSQRVSKIVRKNITKVLLENRTLFDKKQIDKTAMINLSKACIEAHAEKLDAAAKDVYAQSKHSSIEDMFIKNYSNIANFVLNREITNQEIENDSPLISLIAENGQSIDITPSAISVMLAKLKPNFTSSKQREEIYEDLMKQCKDDIKEQNLDTKIPEVLLNDELQGNSLAHKSNFDKYEKRAK